MIITHQMIRSMRKRIILYLEGLELYTPIQLTQNIESFYEVLAFK